jgi:hypothetical protein
MKQSAAVLVLISAGALACETSSQPNNSCPPSLKRELVAPSPDTTVALTTTLTDFDLTDAVSGLGETDVYWYLDYGSDPSTAAPVALGNLSFRLNACAHGLATGERYLLEAFVVLAGGEFTDARGEGRFVSGCYQYVAWVVENNVSCP